MIFSAYSAKSRYDVFFMICHPLVGEQMKNISSRNRREKFVAGCRHFTDVEYLDTKCGDNVSRKRRRVSFCDATHSIRLEIGISIRKKSTNFRAS